MNPPKLFKTLAIAGVVTAMGAFGIQNNAQAGTFISQGYSIFAAPDPTFPGDDPDVQPAPGVEDSRQCAGCDSTVSFAVYQPDTDNWATELGIDPALLSPGVDFDTPYVFFYQVVNTDPLEALENPLATFEIAIEEKTKGVAKIWDGPSPYSSAGWIENTVFGTTDGMGGITHTASSDIQDNFGNVPVPPGGERIPQECLDAGDNGCPGNWTPDVLGSDFMGFVNYEDAYEPSLVLYQPAPNVIDDEVARQGGPSGTSGYQWVWDAISGTDIAPTDPTGPGGRGTSSILFLTADTEQEFNDKLAAAGLVPDYCLENASQDGCAWTKVNYPWARTQSLIPVGEGSSGDVAGLKVTFEKVPEPGSIIGLLALGGLGLASKRKKQK
jgi:hypothetical protein